MRSRTSQLAKGSSDAACMVAQQCYTPYAIPESVAFALGRMRRNTAADKGTFDTVLHFCQGCQELLEPTRHSRPLLTPPTPIVLSASLDSAV